MNSFLTFLGGIAIGLGTMYLLDPQKGNYRRALLRDKAVGLKNDVVETVSGKAEDLSNRAQGLIHEAKSHLKSSAGKTETQTL